MTDFSHAESYKKLFMLTNACCSHVSFYFLPLSVLVRMHPDSQAPEAFTSPVLSHRLSNGHSSGHGNGDRPGASNGGGVLTPCNSTTSSRAARSVSSLFKKQMGFFNAFFNVHVLGNYIHMQPEWILIAILLAH